MDDEQRSEPARTARDGLLGHLRSRHRESEPAGFYRAGSRWRQQPMELRLPAFDLPGNSGFRRRKRSAEAGSIPVQLTARQGAAEAAARSVEEDERAIPGGSPEGAG